MGQRNIHPNDTGSGSHGSRHGLGGPYVRLRPRVEKLQILAFAYGFATHAAGDLFAHTFFNEFTEGVFPAVADIAIGTATNDARELANGLRHFFIEDYINQATDRFDEDGVATSCRTATSPATPSPASATTPPCASSTRRCANRFRHPSAAADTDYTRLFRRRRRLVLTPGVHSLRSSGSFELDGFNRACRSSGSASPTPPTTATSRRSSWTVTEVLEVPGERRHRHRQRRRRSARDALASGARSSTSSSMSSVAWRSCSTVSTALSGNLPLGQTATEFFNELSVLVAA